jgi:hypothetical protein
MLVAIPPRTSLAPAGSAPASCCCSCRFALVFALLVEVVRTMIAGGLKQDRPRPANPLAAGVRATAKDDLCVPVHFADSFAVKN